MKVVWVLGFLIFLGGLALPTKAQTPVDDPYARMNSQGDPFCGELDQPICFGGGTLDVTYADTEVDFVYCPGSADSNVTPCNSSPDLFSMNLDITGSPLGVAWQCQSDIWKDCSVSYDSIDNIWMFAFSGAGACIGPDGSATTCPGFMTPDEEAAYTKTPLVSEVPEPTPVILFGTGLILFFLAPRCRFLFLARA